MRTIRTLGLCACALLAAAALALPAAASAAKWVKGGQSLSKAETIEVNGAIELFDVTIGTLTASTECDVHGEAVLEPGTDGEFAEPEYALNTCEVEGNILEGCEVVNIEAAPAELQIADANHIAVDDLRAWIEYDGECLVTEIETAGGVNLSPNDPGAMSSWTLSGEQIARVAGYESESTATGSLSITPAYVYGTMDESTAPVAVTKAATGILTERATLNAMVDPNKGATSYQFEYGTSKSYGSKVPLSAPTFYGTNPSAVHEDLDGLKPGTYHYRIVATNPKGTSYGEDVAFTIPEHAIVELDGSVRLVDSYSLHTSVECAASGEATLAPGDEGEIVDLEFDPPSCVVSGASGSSGFNPVFEGCEVIAVQPTLPMTIDANDPKNVTIEGFNALIEYDSECFVSEVQTEGDVALKPDNSEAMSKWTLSSEEQVVYAGGLEFESATGGYFDLTPAGVYAIDGS